MTNKKDDPTKNDETEKHSLSSGIPCKAHGCVKCCIDTRMPLSRLDVERISGQGYRFKEFVVKRGKERQLKNSNGRCVFLGDNGCTIYSFRPEGCRLYPLVYNKNNGKAFVHDLCPYGQEYKVGRDDIEKLNVLLKKLDRKE
ncbi:YkgJ family cysteine cluster protein [Candidatus Bathyarchaeota archaeon]|nr:YkgJ family cysteine cluster protein [Candidatus Bathyarchaeota archaeon]